MITLQEIAETIKSKGRFWIAFTGASNVSCEWVHPNWRGIVEYVLQEEMTNYLGDWKKAEWGVKGFNFGYDGATTKDILEKVDYIKLVSPDLVIAMLGGNDEVFKISIAEHVGNIKNIIRELKTKVVWCTSIATGSPDKNKRYEPYSKACMQIPEDDNLQLVDLFNIYKSFPLRKFYTFKSEENVPEHIKEGEIDFLHPNQLGEAYVAKAVLKEVFGIEFDPELYWKDTLAGEKYPKY
jgi:lysophospholipase L1-like esterase